MSQNNGNGGVSFDDQDMALISLCCGVASLLFSLMSHGVAHFLALPLGGLAVWSGYHALRYTRDERQEKRATAGFITGVFGVSAWLVGLATHALKLLWGLVF